MCTLANIQAKASSFFLGNPRKDATDLQGESTTERANFVERNVVRAIGTGLNSAAGAATAAIGNIAMPAIAEGTAATYTAAAGAIFGAISAPIALTLNVIIRATFQAAIDNRSEAADQASKTWSPADRQKYNKIADFAAAAIAAVGAILLTALIMGAIGTPMTFSTAFILGAPMLAFVAIKYLFMPCCDEIKTRRNASLAEHIHSHSGLGGTSVVGQDDKDGLNTHPNNNNNNNNTNPNPRQTGGSRTGKQHQ